MIHLSACPVCGSEKIAGLFTTKDFSVTQQEFEIFTCKNCDFHFTQDIPGENDLARYYQSDVYISHSDTSKGMINRLYHFVRKYTLRQKRKMIENISGKNSGNILDIGSGTGSFLAAMQQAGWTVSGIEPDEIARRNSEKLNGIVSVGPEAINSFLEESIDVITMWHVLEHVHRLHDQMEALSRILKSDGKIFIAVPNLTSYDAKHYGKFWAAWDVPRHLYHFSPSTLARLADRHGFEITRYQPMWFDSFYVSMLSEKYRSGKSNLLKAIFVGLISNMKALFNGKKCSSIIYVMRKKLSQAKGK